ncbi:MAG: DUF1990 family protein [Pseudonocardia sp.]
MAADALADRRRRRARPPGPALRRGADLARQLDRLAEKKINYDPAAAPPHVTDGWHRDRVVLELGHERPGEPEPDGLMYTAGELVNTYQFSDPSIVRAAFRYPSDLVGRDMLLEGRFLALRFLLGVRITGAHDEHGDGPNGPERRIGWSYQTLQGHLEQGCLTYELAKELATGRVEFRILAFSRWSHIPNPVIRAGFDVFGRRTQLRFYRNALRRLTTLLADPPGPPEPDADGVVRAPSSARPGRFEALTLRFADPGA